MEFGLSDEQKMLEASLRGFLAERLPMERRTRHRGRAVTATTRRCGRGSSSRASPACWCPSSMAAPALESSMRPSWPRRWAMTQHPVRSPASLVMAPLALQASGTEAQQAEWLPRIASRRGAHCGGLRRRRRPDRRGAA